MANVSKKEETKNVVAARFRAVEEALTQIKDRFGAGAIMRLGEAHRMQVEVVPTGSLSLDLALGVRGMPRGRIVEIFGPEASGKCVSRDTVVFTNKGMLPIDAFGYLSIPEFQKKEVFVYAEHSFEKTSHFYNGGLKKTLQICTKRGFTLEGTPNHRVRVLDKNGNYLFRRLDELCDDDYIAIQRNQQCFGPGANFSTFKYKKNKNDYSSKSFNPPKMIDQTLAILMGYMIGDGTCTATGFNKNNITITVGDDEVENDLQKVFQKIFRAGARVTKDKRNQVRQLRMHNAQARNFLVHAGLGWWDAATKEIPWSILCSPKSIVAAFISALFECDGCFSGTTIEYCTKSGKLAGQLQTVLLNFGIITTLKKRINKKYGPYFYLYIEGQNDKRFFAKQIGFRSKRKQSKLIQDIKKQKIFKTNLDVIPNLNNTLAEFIKQYKQMCLPLNRDDWSIFYDYLPKPQGGGHALTYDRLSRILKHFIKGRNIPQYQILEQHLELGFYWDRVNARKASISHVVDFTVPKGSTFFGNGFVNHNTTLAQHVVAEVQKLGGVAAFVDAEHALDPEYAKKIGVKVNELFISQPDTGEQALDIVETLVRSNGVDVIVVDSVAALVPRAEIEGDMGDAHMGLQARLMSQALRKLTGIVSKSKTVLIFINQTRQKIGVFFGNPETTTGGTALKFYSSMRIEVRRAAQLKQGESVVGSRVKVKVVKNKVAPPFRTTEFDIMYNEGISLSGDTLDTAVLYDVVKKVGNTFAFLNEKLGVGREAAKLTLRTRPELITQIRKAVFEAADKKELNPPAPAPDLN